MSQRQVPARIGAMCGVFVCLLTCAVMFSCAPKASADGSPTSANPRLRTVEIKAGNTTIVAELAATAEQREKGLMFRTSLKDGEGMLFVFDSDQVLAFWMKNTLVPLSIAYMTKDGKVREIHDMKPGSLEGIQSATSVRYALEVPQGYFERIGVKAGDVLALPPLE